MSTTDARIMSILEEVLGAGVPVEEACRDWPELIPEVRDRLERMRDLELHVNQIFPSAAGQSQRGQRSRPGATLPEIPGYEVEDVVGYGGMGVVYRARHQRLNRTVAIKMLLAGGYAGPRELERFKREAESIAALCHPNIVQVFDAGECDGHPYFTMEFMEGGSLAQSLGGTPYSARRAGEVTATLARAVEFAHTHGVVHRDLKPSNILLTTAGTLKITDYGLAQRRDDTDDALLTLPGARMGTPSYMSPEQATGGSGAYCPAVDVYALGAILYELLTGRPPFRAESPAETQRQVIADDPVAPSRLNPRVPRDLETICLKCLEKDPLRRYESAAALAEDLDRFQACKPIVARRAGVIERGIKWARRRPTHAALAGAGAIALIAALGIGFWVQRIESAHAAEVALRQGRARQAIETSLALVDDLRVRKRWSEARHVLDDARFRVPEANSDELASRLNSADLHLIAARELDEIRRDFPSGNMTGYDYAPAAKAYRRVFAEIGLGAEVPLSDAAAVVRTSPIRSELLVALDSAAFADRVINHRDELERVLAVARMADPDPWRDRFRDPSAWYSRDALLALFDEAGSGAETPSPHQLVIIGVLLSGFGDNDTTINILRDAQAHDPGDFWVNVELGNALMRAGRLADACQYFRAAVMIQPDNHAAWTTLGVCLSEFGSHEEAIIALRRATELSPQFLLAWHNYILFLRVAGRIDDAEAALAQAIEANPHQRDVLDPYGVDIRVDYARVHASHNEWAQALAEYRTALDEQPEDSEIWFEFAAVSALAGDHAVYERACDTMLEMGEAELLRPFLVARAITLTPAPIDRIKRAAALSEGELQAGLPAHWALTQHGAILCRSGHPAEAIPLLEQSIASDSRMGCTVVNWLWLAIAHHQLGHTEESARWHAAAATWLDTRSNAASDASSEQEVHAHDQLEARVLRQEIEARLRSDGE